MCSLLEIHKALVEQRGGGCVHCGKSDHRLLEWVHARGRMEFTIAGMNLLRPKEQLEKEVEKFDLICVACKKV